MLEKTEKFGKANNPETSHSKISGNISAFNKIKDAAIESWKERKQRKLDAYDRDGNPNHYYDDDIVITISEEFADRLVVIFVVGDIIRALGGILRKRKLHTVDQLRSKVFQKLRLDPKVSRQDIAELTRIDSSLGNSITPFMNGGPAGPHWNESTGGLYESIEKAEKSILCVELGFKADDYGLKVSRRLIEKKVANPEMYIALLIDGFVSIFLQKPPSELEDFQKGTLSMIRDMRNAGINVIINDSWNPLSSDFLAANHIKLWIFDGEKAFFGGIGIESQFVRTLYDQMDLVEGPFVEVLTLIALLVMTNQKRVVEDPSDKIENIHELSEVQIRDHFFPPLRKEGQINLTLSMNVPGYVQDAQLAYVKWLKMVEVDEIYIMAPYFSDDKIARALVAAADRILKKALKEKISELEAIDETTPKKELEAKALEQLQKKVHIVFPKKQENKIIEEVSKYYAYYLRENPVVETKQFFVNTPKGQYDMLHAKQMVVVLKNPEKNWTKYVKVGGSYNPAGRAHNMWELNATAYHGRWDQSDDDTPNPIKNYVDTVMKTVVAKYSEPFKWGKADVKLSWFEILVMKLAQLSWF